ncbi:MAG: PAS domain-containing protein [Pontiellaceae bacterium]|nr:PAS domain-containing protein [Pontiellaceae bacterium]
MNTFQSIILIGITGNIIIGLLVWGSNPRRKINQYFLSTTFLIIFWLIWMFLITIQNDDSLLFATKQVDAAAVFLPLGFFILCQVILEPKLSVTQILYRLRYLIIISVSLVFLCQTKFFLKKAYFDSSTGTIPIADYGLGFILYIAYFISSTIGMVLSIPKIFKRTTGAQRQEGLFLLLGWLIGFSFGVVLFTVSNLMGTQEATRFLPLFPLVMNTVVAYGIATRRIHSVSVIVQRIVVYILLAVYLVITYMTTEWLIRVGFNYVISDTSYLSHLVAALVVAFSMIPANSWIHRFSYRLFSSSNPFDMDRVLTESEVILQEVSTEVTLLAAFSDFVTHVFQTTRVVLLEKNTDDSFSELCSFPERNKDEQVSLKQHSSLIELINRDRESFTTDTLDRMRATPLIIKARHEIKTVGAAAVIGCFLHNKLELIILLHPKINGSIYDLREQQTLQRLCNQLAVALENARLYTAIQDGKIYNDILLDSLTSGIIAINETRCITVFNHRAQLITRLNDDILNQPVEQLPEELVDIVNHIFDSDTAVRDVDTFIETSEEWIPIRVSGSVFHGYTGKQLGVLLVFSDMTHLRKMEEKIRRTDRLASIGTLSAGMAHEIKNPLVTVKTFTELLPEQYDDPEFRGTFVDLVQQEVRRIDSIVNRLLNFARPGKAALKPTKLHDVIDNSIRLVEQQLNNKSIHLNRQLKATSDLVMADAEQINQALINLFMNAIEAMSPNGTLTIVTAQQENMLCIDISDTGCGISEEQQKYVFDPFFSTKERGVGLGLSVSHGIVNEHLGRISIESRKGEGTTFHLELPLADEKEEILSE